MKNIHILPTEKPSRLAKLGMSGNLQLFDNLISFKTFEKSPQNIYITNDEEIKEGDYVLYREDKISRVLVINIDELKLNKGGVWRSSCKKIILTTDQNLIKEGVQAIDDEFLEWFVKNPTCEFVEVDKNWNYPLDKSWEYKLRIIPKEEPKLTNVCIKCGVDLYYADNFACQEHPKNCKGIHLSEETLKERALKEEPKQETLEEAFERNAQYLDDFENKNTYEYGFRDGAKWQQEQDKKLYSEEEVYITLQELRLKFKSGVLQWQDDFEFDLDDWFEQFKKK